MRISQEMAQFFKSEILNIEPSADVYLFGSRADDNKRGGDIDILIIGDRKLTSDEKFSVYLSFIKKFGDQKLDLVSFERNDDAPFKRVALHTAVPL